MTNRGSLIDPRAFVAKSADLRILEITSSAATLRTIGNAVEEKATTVKTTWDRLTTSYRAPEQEQVYAVMNPAVTAAADLKSRFSTAARHLDDYAAALEGIKPRLADVERRARAFRASVINGVWVNASESANASLGDHLRRSFDWVPGVDEERVKVPWNQDADTVERNNDLLDEYAQILSDISAAVATCANGVNGLIDGVCMAPVEVIPAEAFTSSEVPMPWGSPALEDRNCAESTRAGVTDFGKGLLEGAGMLIVGYNPETGDWWDSTAYGQAWGGLGDLVGSIVVLASPAGWVASGMALSGNTDNAFSEWMYDRATTVRDAGGSLVGWDPNAEDGWHRWREDGVAAGTSAVLSVGTFFIPGAGQVGAGLKAGSVGARLARIAGVGAEFAVQGGSWLVRGAVRVVTGLESAVLRFNLDDVLRNVRPGQVLDAATGARVSPAGLINAITDANRAAPGVGPHTPVGESLFAHHAPDVTPGRTPSVDAPGGPHAPDAPGPRHPDTTPPAGEHGAPHADSPAPRDGSPETADPTRGGTDPALGDGTGATPVDNGHTARAVSEEYRDYPVQEVTAGQKGAWARELYDLEPNTVYRIDDRHLFVTDDAGRVTHVETELTYRDKATADTYRNNYQQQIAGGEYRLDNDQGGHLVAASLGGPGEPINLVPMDRTLNGSGASSYGALEGTWRDVLKTDPNARVHVTIDLSYPDGVSARPDAFEVEWSVNGGEPEVRGFEQ